MMGIPDTGTEEVAKRPKGPIRHPRRIDAIQVLSVTVLGRNLGYLCAGTGAENIENGIQAGASIFFLLFSFFFRSFFSAEVSILWSTRCIFTVLTH